MLKINGGGWNSGSTFFVCVLRGREWPWEEARLRKREFRL